MSNVFLYLLTSLSFLTNHLLCLSFPSLHLYLYFVLSLSLIIAHDWLFFYLSPHRSHSACVQICVQMHVQVSENRHISVLTCISVYLSHWPKWSSTISTGANSGSRLQLNLRPRGQSPGRKQTHLRQPGHCGGMTYAPTCQTGLAGFDSLGCVAAPPVHYVLAHLVLLSYSEFWLLFQVLIGRGFAQMKSKSMS